MTSKWWFSTDRMTFFVETNEASIVIDAAPIARAFIGQHARNLKRWCARQGGLRIERLR